MSHRSPAASPPIYTVHHLKVVLDNDLARLYGVSTSRLNEAVKRHVDRFPSDFRFQLTREEAASLISQIATSKPSRGGRRKLPWAFTEHGALMAATVLNSLQAIQMSLFIVRAFVRMREELATSAAIFKRLANIDRRLLEHDAVLRDIYRKLLPLLRPPHDSPKRRIGFHTG